MTTTGKRRAVVACLGLLACLVLVLYKGRSASPPLIPIGELSGELLAHSTAQLDRPRLKPTVSAENDARFVLQALHIQSEAATTFRVRQTRHHMGGAGTVPPIKSVFVGAKPNQLVLRYENWDGALVFVSDGERFRVCNEHDRDASRSQIHKQYLSGQAPANINAFLLNASRLSISPPTYAFPELEFMAALPFTDDIQAFLSSRGWGTLRWEETVELDGVLTEHLVFSGRVCRQKSADRAENVSPANPAGSGFEPAESKLHLWIDAEGPALLRKASLGDLVMTYDDWILNPQLPDRTFELPHDHGYKEIRYDFPEDGVFVGRPAPELELASLTGERFQLSSLRGKVVVLDFWGTWCGPCLRELPVIDSVVRDYSGQGVHLLAVTNETDVEQIEETLRELNIDVEPALDIDDKSSLFGVVAIPHLIVIDQEGVIQAVHIGFTSGLEDDLRQVLDRLTQE